MRRVVTMLACALVALVSKAGAIAYYPVTEHDFGVIHESDGLARCEFALVNKGDKVLKVVSARANCGCTTPEYSRRGLAPGDTMMIKVAYDPKGRPGRFEKRIYIDTNAEPQRETLVIRGTVIAEGATLDERFPYHLDPVRLRSKMAMMGDVTPLQSKGTYVEGYNASSDTVRPRAVAANPKLMSIIVQPAVVPPGEQFIYSVVVGPGKEGLWGLQHSPFTAYADAKSTEGEEIDITFIVREDFSKLSAKELENAPICSVSDRVVDLGTVSRDTDKPITATFKVSNIGKDALTIRRVWSTDDNVTFKLKNATIKRGKSVDIEVTLSPAAIAAGDTMVNIPFELITNDPATPVIEMRLAAVVR